MVGLYHMSFGNAAAGIGFAVEQGASAVSQHFDCRCGSNPVRETELRRAKPLGSRRSSDVEPGALVSSGFVVAGGWHRAVTAGSCGQKYLR